MKLPTAHGIFIIVWVLAFAASGSASAGRLGALFEGSSLAPVPALPQSRKAMFISREMTWALS